MPPKRQSFELKIPSMRVQSAWDDIDGKPNKNKMAADEFIDSEQAILGGVYRDFAGRKVRITFEDIGR